MLFFSLWNTMTDLVLFYTFILFYCFVIWNFSLWYAFVIVYLYVYCKKNFDNKNNLIKKKGQIALFSRGLKSVKVAKNNCQRFIKIGLYLHRCFLYFKDSILFLYILMHSEHYNEIDGTCIYGTVDSCKKSPTHIS